MLLWCDNDRGDELEIRHPLWSDYEGTDVKDS